MFFINYNSFKIALLGITNVSRDKFLVMAMDIGTEGFSSGSELADKWKSEPRDNIMEYRLRTNVILKSPTKETAPDSLLLTTATQNSAQHSAQNLNQNSGSLEKKIDDLNRKVSIRLRKKKNIILDTLDAILPKLQFTKNGLTTDIHQHVCCVSGYRNLNCLCP
jgi:hypothetical protein